MESSVWVLSTNRETTYFWLNVEQTVNRLRKIAWLPFSIFCLMSRYPCLHVSLSPSSCFHVSISMSPCLHVHISLFPQTKNRTNGKWQLPFAFCKRKTEIDNFRLFAANGHGKEIFFFLRRQMINSNWRLLFRQTCQSMSKKSCNVCHLFYVRKKYVLTLGNNYVLLTLLI